MGNDKKIVEYLQQKVYFQRALIYIQSGNYKESADLLYKCLNYGSVYNVSLKIKCMKHLEFVFSRIPNFENEEVFMGNIARFYSPQRRDFLFLIDSTYYLSEKLSDIMLLIKDIFHKKMVKNDALTIYRFDEDIECAVSFKKKRDILRDDTFFETLYTQLMYYICN